MAAICKRCKTEMDNLYCFEKGAPYHAKRTIEYDEKGNLKKKGREIIR